MEFYTLDKILALKNENYFGKTGKFRINIPPLLDYENDLDQVETCKRERSAEMNELKLNLKEQNFI